MLQILLFSFHSPSQNSLQNSILSFFSHKIPTLYFLFLKTTVSEVQVFTRSNTSVA